MLTPKIVTDFGVNHRQIGIARRGLLIAIRNAVFLDVSVRVDGEGERLAHFRERVLAAVLQPEAHLDDLFLMWGEGLQW